MLWRIRVVGLDLYSCLVAVIVVCYESWLPCFETSSVVMFGGVGDHAF